MRKVYLDNAATTCVSNEVINEMMPVLTQFMAIQAHSIHMGAKQPVLLTEQGTESQKQLMQSIQTKSILLLAEQKQTTGQSKALLMQTKKRANISSQAKSSIMLFWKLAKNLRAKVLKLHIFLLMNMELSQLQNLCTTSEKTPF